MSFLLEPWKEKRPVGSDLNMLQGDSQLIVVAGRSLDFPPPVLCNPFLLTKRSDTTASALTSTLYELAKLPSKVSELRNEVASLVKSGGTISNKKLQSLASLNGAISETLRLHPPTGLLQRKTPPEGLTIGGTYVPGNITVLCPQYAAGRSKNPGSRISKRRKLTARHDHQARASIPTRWISAPSAGLRVPK